MKRFIIFLRLYWLRIILAVILLIGLVATIQFVMYCFQNYGLLEDYSKRQISGQMALLLPMFVLVNLLALPIMLGLQYYFMQGGLAGSIGKEKAGLAKVNVKWDQVIGMEGAKKEAWELVKLLKDRHLLKMIGGKIIKGTLMIGPPGCGKTYLAKAIATECGLPFISAVGSDFVGIFVGQGAAQMKTLFKQARALASLEGGCLIFIDEIDSFARPRQEDRGFGGGVMSHNATINQFLTELDGLRKAENNIVVIAATNVPEYQLDSALMRAGRFERKIYITKPNLKERKQLFDFYLKQIKTDPGISSSLLARKSLWFSPADIEAMTREAGLIALRSHRDVISMKDLSEAYDRVIFGDKSNIIMNDDDKKWTAYHEAGHAILTYLIHPKDDVIKATIIPRKGALGFVAHSPAEEHYSYNREYHMSNIKIALAGYAAEKLIFNSTSSGVTSDFEKAMSTAQSMVWNYGMGKSGLVGDFHSDYYEGYRGRSHSEKTIETLDNDVQAILKECIDDVTKILTEKKDLLEYFSQELLKKEELEYEEIQAIFDKFGLKPISGRAPIEI
jgi:cell division protease FtsH